MWIFGGTVPASPQHWTGRKRDGRRTATRLGSLLSVPSPTFIRNKDPAGDAHLHSLLFKHKRDRGRVSLNTARAGVHKVVHETLIAF